MMVMNYCSKCGHKLAEGDRFCSGCGERIVRQASENAAAPRVAASSRQGGVNNSSSQPVSSAKPSNAARPQNPSNTQNFSNTQNASRAQNPSQTQNTSRAQNPSQTQNTARPQNPSNTQNTARPQNPSQTQNSARPQNPSNTQNSAYTQNTAYTPNGAYSQNTAGFPGASVFQNSGTFGAEPTLHESEVADSNAVQYVYVDKKTGRITQDPRVTTRSEGCFQFFGIALAAVAVVILMVVGALAISGAFDKKSGRSGDYEMWEVFSEDEVSSVAAVSSEDLSDEPDSSDPVSSEAEEVSSEPAVPEDLLAKNLQKRIKGQWRTEVPYKSMNLPGTFEFDGKSKCKCTIKAFLFSKKFEGEYKIKDGGECELYLEGLDEYSENDMMTGQLKFINDNKIEFTVGDTVWKLNRVE